MGDADLVFPPLRRDSRKVSRSNLAGAEVGQDSEGEDGLKTSDVSERVRAEVSCDKCGKHMRHDAGMTNCLWHTKANDLSHVCSRGE